MLTGTGIRIGTATSFDVGERFPRALASDGTQVILFGSRKGYLLDPTTGAATVIGTIDNFGRSEQQCRSATYHNGGFVFWGNSRKTIYNYDPTDGSTSDAHGQPLQIQNTNTNPDLWGLTSLNGVLYTLDRPSAKLYTVDLLNNVIIPVGDATDYGLAGSPNIQAFTAYKGELIGASTGLDQLVRINETTGVATAISTLLLPDTSSEALVDHAGQLLMAGSAADALFRLYDVLWNEIIADLEVNEGASETWSLSGVSQDAASFALQGTPPSWLSVSGTNLAATTAPDVAADTNYDVMARATRDGINVDKTLRVVVRNLAPTLATFSITTADTDIREGESVDFTVTSDIAITDFILTDITVTGGTANSLTATGTNIWTLNVTAGTGTGTLNIAIAENAVLPGNSAFTQDFTRTALPTFDIEFPVTELVGGTPTTCVIIADQDITGLGFDTDDVTISVGTKGAFTSTGTRTATLVVTAPAGSGSMAFTIRQNAVSVGNAEYTESINYAPPPADALSFGSETIPAQAWVVGTPVSLTLPEATGGTGAKTYSLSPTTPAGINFTAATRALAGTPTGRFSIETFTYSVTDADNDTLSLTFTVVVTAPALTFASTIAAQAWLVGTAVSVTLPTASGGVGAKTYSLTPALPSGTTFTAGTRALAGTPTGRFASTTYTYTVTDSEGVTQTQTFTVVVTATAITFSPTTFTNQSWVVGTAVAETLPAGSGGVGNLTASLSPTTPAGVTFTAATRALAGNPSATFTSATFTYTMTDEEGIAESITFTIVVSATPNTAPDFADSAYTFTDTQINLDATIGIVSATDVDNDILTYSLTGTNASDFSINANGQITSAVALAYDTTYTFNVVANDGEDTTTVTVSVTTRTDAATPAVTGYQIQVYDKNWKSQSGTDGTLARTLTHAVSIRIQRDLNRPKTLTFQVPRKGDDADAIEIGKVVRVIDGTDVVASFVIAGPLDKTRPLVTVNALGKEEILNWAITPWDFKLESSTAADQIAELLKNYRFFRQNTEDQFNDGTHSTTEVTSVAESTTETNYYVTLTQTGEDYNASGTFISQPILLTDDFLGDPTGFARLRYVALLGNDTNIKVEFRHSNDAATTTPSSVGNWSLWSSEYDTSSDSETQQQLGITGYSISDDFRWVQMRFSLSTSDVTITPALQAFEIVAEYPSEITAGSISLAGDALDETFSFQSHLSAIQRIVAARNAEFRVNDDYELDIAERFGVTTPTVTYTVHSNCEVVRFQQQDRRLSTEIWSLGSAGQGLTQPFETSASEPATEAYGSRPWIYTPNATTETARTQEIADELALRDTPTNAVVITETDTTESIEVGDLVSFEYTERSIDTTLRVIAITVADPRLGTPRQIELISDEGFFASQADAIAGVTQGVTGGVTGADAEDLDILEWYWFAPVDVFTDDTGAFSGTALSSVDENLNNPSGADVVLSVVSHSPSISSASFNASNDLIISVSGVSANASGNVFISAVAMVGGVERTVQQQIDIRLVFNTVDLDGYVTDAEITEFVTASVTDGLATDTELANATSGLIDTADLAAALTTYATDTELTNATSGLATDTELANATSGLIDTADLAAALTTYATDTELTNATSGLATDTELANATSGLIDTADLAAALTTYATDTELTNATSGLATDTELANATSGLIDTADLAAALTTYATDTELTNATSGLATDTELTNATSGLASDADIAAALTTYATDTELTNATSGLATDTELTNATSGLASDADIAAALTTYATDTELTNATSGLATDTELTNATSGLASDADIAAALTTYATDTELTNATSGLATDTELTNATSGLASDADIAAALTTYATDTELTNATSGLATDADIAAALTTYATDTELANATSGLPTDADLAAALTTYATDAELAAALTTYATDADIADFVSNSDIADFVTDAEITQFISDADIADFLTGSDIADFISNSDIADFVTDAEITQFISNSDIADFVSNSDIADFVTDAEITQFISDADIADFLTGSDIADFISNSDIADFVTDAEITQFISNSDIADFVSNSDIADFVTDAEITQFISDADIADFVSDSEITEFVTASVTDGLVSDSEITEFVTASVTDGLASDDSVVAATDGLATVDEVVAATDGLVTEGVTEGITDGLVSGGGLDEVLTTYVSGDGLDEVLTEYVSGDGLDEILTEYVSGEGLEEYVEEELFEDVAPFIDGVSDYIDIAENLDEKKLVIGFSAGFINTLADIETRLSNLEA